MNRNEEAAALLAELQETPPALNYTVQRAQARQKKRRWGRLLGIPVGSVAVFFLSFTLLVNFLPTFARACGGVPVLRELAMAVAWSPSLSAAVEHDYVQPMDLEQTVNEITARIEYVIVDQKQLNIFYTLNSPVYDRLQADLPKMDAEGASTSMSSFGLENGELSQYTVNFFDQEMPDTLGFTMFVSQWPAQDESAPPMPSRSLEEDALAEIPQEESETLAEFAFTLHLDPWYTGQGETLAIDQNFTLDGQTLNLQDAEIFPSHMRLNFADTPENTAWLYGFDFYLENEKEERFEGISNGISATGDMRIDGKKSFHMESTFFSESEELTLYIQRVYWLGKDKERFLVDLETGTADWLPDGTTLEKVTPIGSDWVFTFTAKIYQAHHAYSIINGFLDLAGNEILCDSSSSHFTENGLPGERFEERVPLRDYAGTQVYVEPIFSRVTEFETPVAVRVK